LLFVLFYVLFVCKCVLPPGDNPIAVNKYIKIIRSSKTVIEATGFTYVFGKTRGCNYSFWAPDDARCVAQNML